MDAWLDWLLDVGSALDAAPPAPAADTATETALRQRIAELEARLAAAGLPG
jgi:hypothetical protein